eukprot:COSAG02_NODE_3971_length_5973_cov_5.170582_2_plen_289_part_00
MYLLRGTRALSNETAQSSNPTPIGERRFSILSGVGTRQTPSVGWSGRIPSAERAAHSVARPARGGARETTSETPSEAGQLEEKTVGIEPAHRVVVRQLQLVLPVQHRCRGRAALLRHHSQPFRSRFPAVSLACSGAPGQCHPWLGSHPCKIKRRGGILFNNFVFFKEFCIGKSYYSVEVDSTFVQQWYIILHITLEPVMENPPRVASISIFLSCFFASDVDEDQPADRCARGEWRRNRVWLQSITRDDIIHEDHARGTIWLLVSTATCAYRPRYSRIWGFGSPSLEVA